MNTLFADSSDGTRVAYDRSGTGPAIVLLHGGGSMRQGWHEAGYVRRLRDDFTVITLDLRGHGESGLPTDPADYTTARMGQDILDDRYLLRHLNVPVMLAWVRAMLDWPAIEPADFRRPTLWLVGPEDRQTMASLREYEESLKGSMVQVHIVEGLDHNQVFAEADRVFPTLVAFTQI
jgi:pimeloyl-ACP methyl ester carboxylesterase